MRAVIGQESAAGGIDRRARVDTDAGKLCAQPRIAADVIQVPVRIDDGRDGAILLARKIEHLLRVFLVPTGVEHDQSLRRRDDDAVAVGLAVRCGFTLDEVSAGRDQRGGRGAGAKKHAGQCQDSNGHEHACLLSRAVIRRDADSNGCRLGPKAGRGFMRTTIVLAASLLAGIAAAQTSVQSLAKPPAAALHFTIISTAGKHGESARWTTSEGIRMGRESFMVGGEVLESESALDVGAEGVVDWVNIGGFRRKGDAGGSLWMAW